MPGSASAELEPGHHDTLDQALGRLEAAQEAIDAALESGATASALAEDARRQDILEGLLARASAERPGPQALVRLAALQARVAASTARSGVALRALSENAGRHSRALKGYRGR